MFGKIFLLVAVISLASTATLEKGEREEALHFGFQTENGHQRTEDIKYTVRPETDTDPKATTTPKPVEYRGGYSFISADGYEYQVLYKANKNGFQPYVTAHKIKPDKS
ncbi:endocuticle structural protein SgAbd-6 [Drosophila bipectinata]|uniref:endocuticle structural protein SgAbd-6 n=1 Tax=Drosophila bipectinata TaxID=42026 RepID=UPI0007E609DB|nr:endocuticle structural protein SgAbd-6 [Drosophila bipectinata]